MVKLIGVDKGRHVTLKYCNILININNENTTGLKKVTADRVPESCVIVLLNEIYLKSLIQAIKTKIPVTLVVATDLVVKI